ncbi:MAG TPA: cytochrome b N-terminal domain-containing protein [Bryobacteraceae bacterium]|nr:cytochrome b N-terminal domain-containing protein [Bryobacteraceae bacterium]
MLNKVLDWVEERTGATSGVAHFLNEDIPGSSGWHQVLGSVAMFCFLVQFVTGILLALNYAPTPPDAHESLRFILTELTSGRLIRGLHHWGASMMIVVVVLHLLQVFLWGAYKKPREATWMLGVVLLLLTLGFGLTGYLLPWDNRAYWGTVVTTQITAKAPIAGPYILRLMGSEDGQIGVQTFARFYGAHVLLLPPITMLLIGLHVFLVRKHGVAPAPVETEPTKKFYPGQVFKDTVAIFVMFAILFALATLVRVPLGKIADPTDTTYIPRPEWYFLFLFQLLKFFEGPLEIVGSMVLPGVAVGLLFATPFIDRGKAIQLRQRTFAIGIVLLAGIGWAGLTAAAMRTTPIMLPWNSFTAEEVAAVGSFRQGQCWQCHGTTPGDAKSGPNLADIAVHEDRDVLVAHFQKHAANSGLKDSQFRQLANFLRNLDDESVAALPLTPNSVVAGAQLYMKNNCGVCHIVRGAGGKSGPPLNGVASRRDRAWLEGHFMDPQKFSPGTMMPPYKFNRPEMDNMLAYMEALKD